MTDENKQLLLAIMNRLDQFQTEVNARFDQMQAENNQRFEEVNRRFAHVNKRIKTLESRMLAIGFELKQYIAGLNEKIVQLQVDIFQSRADSARAIVAVTNLEKRVSVLEATMATR